MSGAQNGPGGPNASPVMLPPPPKRGVGVRRLNKRPIWFGAGVVMLVVGAGGYAFIERFQAHAEAKQAQEDSRRPEAGSAAGITAHYGEAHVQPAAAKSVVASVSDKPPQDLTVGRQQVQDQKVVDLEAEARAAAWKAYYNQTAQVQKARVDAELKAMQAGSGEASGAAGGVSGITGSPGAAVAPGAVPGLPGGADYAPGGSGPAEKRAFLAQQGDLAGVNEDLMAVKHGPKPDTVMEGTAIPAVMVGGMTSDMPGMVIGQVSQNVCDSQTGDDLLIPQGSRLVGKYDNSISQGQTRIGVIWNRIIFPDTSSLQIGSMEGADQGGYAGFHDQVDTHFWEKLGSSLLISIAGAAVQLSQPPPSTFGTYSPASTGTAALTQQMSQLGQEYARAGLSIPNTLEIRPGYNFTVMVNKDMAIPPYHGASCRNPAAAYGSAQPVNLGPVLR